MVLKVTDRRATRRKIRRAVAAAATVWVATVIAAASSSARAAGNFQRPGADYFPNVTLTTQDGAPVRFYDDLLKGKIVAINLIYTTCQYACPLETARLAQVQKLLGDRMGRDVFFYSITIDPEHDTPAVLKEYAKKFHAGPGWLFLTGDRADIELITKKIGLYSPNSDRSTPDGHRPYLLVGNEATGQWMRNSAVDNPQFMARTIGDWLNSWQTAKKESSPSYADVPRLAFDKGQYTFISHCAACHTIGRGDNIGPDLLGVTATRDRSWLTRFIFAPEKMNAAGDPIAVALREKYKEARMPNLNLSAADVAGVIDYIDRRSRAVEAAGAPAPAKATAAATMGAVDLMPIVNPYVRIQQALNADSLERIGENARSIAAEAAKLGATGESIRSAAGKLQQAADLTGARAALGELSDAILIHAKETNARFGDDVKVAYCPMARKYWLQKGEQIRNPYYGTEMSECGRLSPELPTLKK